MKHYPFTLLVLLAIVILSLMPVPETPLSEVHYIDKWTHILMYFGQTSAVWLDYCRLHGLRVFSSSFPWIHLRGLQYGQLRRSTLVWGSLVFPIALGILMEILQETCTNHLRSGDWVDACADALGSLLGYLICALIAKSIRNR